MKIVQCSSMAFLIFLGILVGLATAAPQSQSLGDYARAVRKDKKPSTPKQYDNDNLPVNEKLSVVGNTSGDSSAPSGDAKAIKDGDQPGNDSDGKTADQKKLDPKADETPEQREARYNGWKENISKEKGEMDQASKELDLLQREYRLRAAAFYGDAGVRLRNSAEWDKENTQYQQQIAEKQKDVEAAKQKIEDLEEQARKAGVPSAVRE
jgi:hypothetical protein